MGDLISRSAFEKFIKEKYRDNESTDDIKDQMLFDLSYQPTAYNVEDIQERLKHYLFMTYCIDEDPMIEEIIKNGVDYAEITRGCKSVKAGENNGSR